MISKACYKPHTIFFSLPVKNCLVYTSWKLLVAVHCRRGKKNGKSPLRYVFSRKREFYSKLTKKYSKITLEKRSNGLYNYIHHNLKSERNFFCPILALREKKP